MGKERQIRRQEEIRNQILNTARLIVAEEGFEKLSVRKIASRIDYSPAIIYHYFKDKNEILHHLLGEGYARIIRAVQSVDISNLAPEEAIKATFVKYISTTMENPDIFRVLISSEPQILEHTSVLKRGSGARKAFQLLMRLIEDAKAQERFKDFDTELTAQILWTATYGLMVRLAIEKDIPEEQVNRLLDQHFTILFNGILRKEG